MKTIASWNDLEPFGIVFLTGEACGLMYRYLCDLTPLGKAIVEKVFDLPDTPLPENWNRGSDSEPHVASILLPPEMLLPIAIFALLENGCTEVFAIEQSAVGIESTDDDYAVDAFREAYGDAITRRFSYQGTAGDRNVHRMSGRIR